MTRILMHTACFAVAAAAWNGCAGISRPDAGILGGARYTAPDVTLSSAGGSEQPVLFVADLFPAVSFYSANIRENNPPLLGTITQGVTRAQGLSIGQSGILYVANDADPASIAEYYPGSTTPFKTLTNGLRSPAFLAADRSGTLYVDDTGAQGVIVLVYSPGGASPIRIIDIPNQGHSPQPGGVAFDDEGNLLVGTFSQETELSNVYAIAPGTNQAINLHLQGLPGDALGTDAAGNLYVGGHQGEIAVYAPGGKTPVRYINAGNAGFYSGLSVTPDGAIYWPNYQFDEMYEFAPGSSVPTNVFIGGGVDAAVAPW